MYYIRLLLYDIVTVTVRFSHDFYTKCIRWYFYRALCTMYIYHSSVLHLSTHKKSKSLYTFLSKRERAIIRNGYNKFHITRKTSHRKETETSQTAKTQRERRAR